MIDELKDTKRCRQFCLRRPGGKAMLEALVVIAMAAVAAIALYTVLSQLSGEQSASRSHLRPTRATTELTSSAFRCLHGADRNPT